MRHINEVQEIWMASPVVYICITDQFSFKEQSTIPTDLWIIFSTSKAFNKIRACTMKN